ncbi:DUF2490 domain-containing protein [Gaetbulibacter aestuarii]|uniref:DUF2490 domain-containing protein n=1 Tax=Gaetbulibacter aestuarii TaxID=1502358 RepID=A0ABW7MZ55_9FLAO
MKLFPRFILIVLFTTSLSFSQSTPETTLGAWYMIDGNHQISKRISLKTGLQLRTFEPLDNINLMFYYTGVNYHLKNKSMFTLAYCYLDIDKTFSSVGTSHLFENRFYEQYYIKSTALLPINHRIRLEQRIFNYQHSHNVKHRMRYRIGSKIILNKSLFISASNEFFFNFQDQIMDENRFQICLGFNISKSANIQLGYLNHEIHQMNLNRMLVSYCFKTNWMSDKKEK